MFALTSTVVSLLVLLVLDIMWVRHVMHPWYARTVCQVQGGRPMVPRVGAGVVAYALMMVGLLDGVLPRVSSASLVRDSVRYGFVYGAVLYGVYDATTVTVLVDWDVWMAIVDVLWGGTVFALAALASGGTQTTADKK